MLPQREYPDRVTIILCQPTHHVIMTKRTRNEGPVQQVNVCKLTTRVRVTDPKSNDRIYFFDADETDQSCWQYPLTEAYQRLWTIRVMFPRPKGSRLRARPMASFQLDLTKGSITSAQLLEYIVSFKLAFLKMWAGGEVQDLPSDKFPIDVKRYYQPEDEGHFDIAFARMLQHNEHILNVGILYTCLSWKQDMMVAF